MLSTVVNLLFLCALDFSLVVEAVQTLIHSDHMDSMHRPDIICIVAGLGIVLNFVCILLIGGNLKKIVNKFQMSCFILFKGNDNSNSKSSIDRLHSSSGQFSSSDTRRRRSRPAWRRYRGRCTSRIASARFSWKISKNWWWETARNRRDGRGCHGGRRKSN